MKKNSGKKGGKRVWLWVELKNSGKKILEKVSGYGLNLKNSGKRVWLWVELKNSGKKIVYKK